MNATQMNLTEKEEKIRRLKLLLEKRAGHADESFPLSYGQQALFFIYKSASDNHAYNVSIAFTIKIDEDPGIFQQAASEMVACHQALHCVYRFDGILPRQEVKKLLQPAFEFVYLPYENAEKLAGAVKLARHLPFDLEAGPAIRFHVFATRKNEYVLLICAHHIAVDGRSLMLLAEEWKERYSALKKGIVYKTAFSYPFSDFVEKERHFLQSEKGKKSLNYWVNKLNGELPELSLPFDFTRPARKTYEGGAVPVMLDARLTEQVRNLAKREGVTVFVALLATYYLLLHKYGGQEDVIVGTPVLGRNLREQERAIGNFMNTIPLRSNPVPETLFTDFLKEVRETLAEAIEHSALPFSFIVENLKLKRSAGTMPVFQTILNIQKRLPPATSNDPGIEVNPFLFTQQEGVYDLMLDLVDDVSLIHGTLKYDIGLFAPETPQQMVRHFEVLLSQVVERPHCCLSEYELVVNKERKMILEDWNSGYMPFDRHLTTYQMFNHAASVYPNSIAIVDGRIVLTYAELKDLSARLAARLSHAHGIGSGNRIVLMLNRSAWIPVFILAAWQLGAAYIPVDPAFPPERINYILRDAEPQLVITEDDDSTKAAGGFLAWQIDETLAGMLADLPGENSSCMANGSKELAYIIYTSGSTGKPKGVMISQPALTNFLLSMQKKLAINHRHTLFSVTTCSFDISLLEYFLPLISGATVRILSREELFDVRAIGRLINEAGAPFMQATPGFWKMLLNAGWEGNPQLIALSGGEKLDEALASQLLERSGTVWNMYGPTETTVWSSCQRIVLGKDISLGQPIGNTSMYVLNSQFQPLPPGVPGELFIGGAGLADGYWKKDALTQERFIPNPFQEGEKIYRTGDLVKWDQEGRIHYLGRTDFQVKIRGHRIEPGEIERLIMEWPGINEVIVAARDDKSGGQMLVAYYTCLDDAPVDADIIRKYLRQHLPEYMVPAFFVLMDRMPLTPNGKTDRLALPDPELNKQTNGASILSPGNEWECRISDLWKKALGIEQISVTDNFFDIGGYSILLVGIYNALIKEFSLSLSVTDMFVYPTIQSLASFIQEGGSLSQAPDERSSLRQAKFTGQADQRMKRKKARATIDFN